LLVSLFGLKDWDDRSFRNVYELPKYTALQPRRWHSS
jgi:hypothetical protein